METPTCHHQYVAVPVRKFWSAQSAIAAVVILAGIAVAPLGLVGCLTLVALGVLIGLQPGRTRIMCAKCKETA